LCFLDGDSNPELIIGGDSASSGGICYKNINNRSHPVWEKIDYFNGIISILHYNFLTFADINNDGLVDCLMGDYNGKIYAFKNNGTVSSPSWEEMIDWESNFPDFGYYSFPFLVDIDSDEDFDCFIGSASSMNWYPSKVELYLNTGNSTSPQWSYNKTIHQSSDSYEARIALVDLDNDTDYDLVIGREGSELNYISSCLFYRNIGTNSTPLFQLDNQFFNNPTPYAGMGGSPTFIDWDEDGDYDLILGDKDFFNYYENIGNATNPQWKQLTPLLFEGIHPSSSNWRITDIRPQMIDYNFDGKLDLMFFPTGGYAPGVAYSILTYINIGNGSENLFMRDYNFQPNRFDIPGSPSFGYSSAADIDNDSKIEIIMFNGQLILLENIGTNENPEWVLNSTYLSGLNIKDIEGVVFEDLNDDLLIDFVTFYDNGTIHFYQNIGTPNYPQWIYNQTYFGRNSYTNGDPPDDLSFADLNADSKLELIFNRGSSYIWVYQNNGTPNNPNWFENSSLFVSQLYNLNMGWHFDFADLNNDSYIDIVGVDSDETGVFNLFYSAPLFIDSISFNTYCKENPTWSFRFEDSKGLDDGFYKINDGPWKILFQDCNSTIFNQTGPFFNSTEWDALPEGVEISLYLGVSNDAGVFEAYKYFDTTGYVLRHQFKFWKDTTAPIIVDSIPENGTYRSTDSFSVSIDDPGPTGIQVDTCLAKLDTNSWNTFFSGSQAPVSYIGDLKGLTGINFTDISEGLHKIYFKLKDTLGNLRGNDSDYFITFSKDTHAPNIYQDPQTIYTEPIYQTIDKIWINGTSFDNESLIYNSGVVNTTLIDLNATGVTWVNAGNATHWAFYNTSNIPDGIYYLQITTTDKANNTGILLCNIRRDTLPPTASQANYSLYITVDKNHRIWVNGTANDPVAGLNNVTIISCNATGVTWSANQGTLSNWAFYNTTNISDGNYNMILNISDTVGHYLIFEFNFTVDTVKPSVTIYAPQNNTNHKTLLLFNVSISEDHFGYVEFYYYDTTWHLIGINSTAASFITYLWNLTAEAIDLDNITISVNATDRAGNMGSRASTATITVDGVPPTIILISPTDSELIISNEYWLNSSTSSSDIQTVSFYYYNGSSWNYIGTNTSKGSNVFTLKWNVAGLDLENVMILVNATDHFGFYTTYQTTSTITVDNVYPTPTIIEPHSDINITNTYLLNVSVRDVDVIYVEFFYFNGTGWDLIGVNDTHARNQSFTYLWNTTGVDLTSTILLFNLTDDAGLVSSINTSEFSIKVDNVRPIVNLIAPIDNENISGIYNLKAQVLALDTVRVEFYYYNSGWIKIAENTTPGLTEYIYPWNTAGLDLDYTRIRVNVTDDFGFISTNTTLPTIKVDSVYPTPIIINPNKDVNITGIYTLNVSVIDNDVLFAEFYFLNVSEWQFIGINNTHANNQSFTFQWNTAGIDLDSTILMINVTDDFGYTSSVNTSNLNIKIDNIKPTVQLNAPKDNENITGIYKLNATVNNLDSIRVEFYYYDSGWVKIGENTTPGLKEYIFYWDTSGVDLNYTRIRVNVSDDFGFIGTDTTTNTIKIDTVLPTITLLDPSNDAVITSNYTLLAITPNNDILTVEFYFFDNDTWYLIGINDTNPGASSFTLLWDTDTLNINNTIIQINATDDMGFVGSYTTTASIKIDNSPPEASQSIETSAQSLQDSTTIWINGTASDLVQLFKIQIYPSSLSNSNLTGVIWSENLGSNENWAFKNLTTIPDGYWWIKLNISDISGQYINITTYIWVDTQNPLLIQDNSTLYSNIGQNSKPYWVNGTYIDSSPIKNITIIAFNGTAISWYGGMVDSTHWAFYSTDDLADNIYNVSIQAFDISNKSRILHCLIYVDFNAPNLIYDGPIVNNTISDKCKFLNFTVNDKFLNTVQWKSSITEWSTDFVGSFDIDLSNFSCNSQYIFQIRAIDNAGNENSTNLTIIFNKRTLISGNTIVNALVDGIWINILTSQKGYIEIEKLSFNPHSESVLPGQSQNIFYQITTNLTTFNSELRVYINDTSNLQLYYWDEHNLEWKSFINSGSSEESPSPYLWATTNTLGYITVLKNPSSPSNGLDMTIIIIIIASCVGIVTTVYAVYNSKRKIKAITPKTLIPQKLKKDVPINIKVLRGGEIKGKSYVFKVKIMNESEFNVTDVSVQLVSYPSDCLELKSKVIQKIAKLDAKGFVSPTFEFQPTHDCVKGKILANVSFVDIFNKLHTIEIQPHEISMICGLFKPIKISNDEFTKITKGLLDYAKAGEEIRLPFNARLMFMKLKTILPNNNFQIINEEMREIQNTFFGIIRGFAEGKFSKNKVGVEITITGGINDLESVGKIEAFSQDEFVLPPLISDLNSNLQTWKCTTCNEFLTEEQVELLLIGKPITCKSCNNVMTKIVSESFPEFKLFESIRQELAELKMGQERIIATQELTLTKIEEINEYVIELMKLIPLPSKIEISGKVRKTLSLQFTCAIDNEWIATLEEKSWTIWIKYITAVGKATLEYVPGLSLVKKLVNTATSIYSKFSGGGKLPANVVKLTTQERENLRKILIDAGIMDKMKYCPKCKRWVCNKHYTERRCCEECFL